ncbi:pentapeptide repeat-containing protein [Poseidonocella sp. HB161398]|uniref:pentapeptide repeat-containing protein n=1 Tax=Poseidonocella sp. HB161398 TaxID=2320855 RepID=UPI001486E131|nr:pentapeptide repeat-containing protein [Poseidonocella sp. HB161398]
MEVPLGSISLPAVSYPVSVLEFFAIAPLVVLAVHALLLQQLRQRLLEGRMRPSTDMVLIPATAFSAPVLILAIQGTYAPFARLPPPGTPTAGWLVAYHCLCLAAAATLTIRALIADGRSRTARPRMSPDLRAGLLAATTACCVLAALRVLRCLSAPATALEALGPGAPLHVLLGLAFLCPLPVLALGSRLFPFTTLQRSLPMPFRIFLLTLFAAAAANLAAARGIDLSGQTLMRRLPSEQMIGRYMARSGDLDGLRGAWLRAHLDFGRELDLAGWNLAGARFRNAVLLRTNFSGATLTGANFAGAELAGTVFDNAGLAGARFEQARFYRLPLPASPYVLAASEQPPDQPSAPMSGVSFRNADLTRAVFTSEAAPEDGRAWKDFCAAAFAGSEASPWLQGADFEGATLEGAVLQGLDATNVRNLAKAATLANAKLNCANLQCFDFSAFSADQLKGIELNGADLRGATPALDEIPTNLEGASLIDAILYGNPDQPCLASGG